MANPHLDIPEARLAVIDGEVWDLEIEEPLASTDAYEARLAELTSDELEDDVFVAAVLQHVMSGSESSYFDLCPADPREEGACQGGGVGHPVFWFTYQYIRFL